MLFRTVNHYESENDEKKEEIYEIHEETNGIGNINKQEQIECFICFDVKTNNEIPIRLKNQIDFYKFCDCDVYVHTNCLNTWYEKYEECPICRNTIKKLDCLELYNLYQYQYGVYIIYSFLVIKKSIYISVNFLIKIIRRMLIFMLILIITCMINEIYKSVIYELEKKENKYYLSDFYYYEEPLVNRIVPMN